MEKRTKNVDVTESSGNIFADLGFDNPEEELARAKLALAIQQAIKRRRLTQAAVAKLVGLDQPKVSAILNGHLNGYSSDRMIRLLAKLGYDVDIAIVEKTPSGSDLLDIKPRTRPPEKRTVERILEKARDVARDYYAVTGKPLGLTGEMGEYIAAKRLGLTLAPARTAGYDAKDRQGRRIQIKSRVLPSFKKLGGQRVGSIKLNQPWDDVVLVLMSETFEPHGIYKARRSDIQAALSKPGSKARNKRGMLGVNKFIQIGKKIWSSKAVA